MGEAKRRGLKAERIAQAIEREQRKAAERTAVRRAAEAAEAELIRNLPSEVRKEILLRRPSPRHLSQMLALAAMTMAATSTGSDSK